MKEHEHEGVKIIVYRFPENKPLADDPDGLRFNFEPCFAIVGDEFDDGHDRSSSARNSITELKKPTRRRKASPAVLRGRRYAAGAADVLAALADPLITDAILSRGIGLDRSAEGGRRAGGVGEDARHGADRTRRDRRRNTGWMWCGRIARGTNLELGATRRARLDLRSSLCQDLDP